jgi:hypothetical protein
MHEDFGSHAGREPDPVERGYRIDVLLDGVPEIAGLALMHRIADLLVEEGLAAPEGGEVRAVIGMQQQTWTPDLAEALHVVIPRAVPQSPDLGANYSPN